jgi:hypothetical protein
MIPNLELHTKLSNLFHIGFNFITAENISKPKWRTNRKYRLTRGEFIKRYSDELTLLGVSFGTQTKYFMLDIDRGSSYHPANDRQALPILRQLLEKIGIVRVDIIRSSDSEGIHIYGCLPKNVSTIRLATLLHVTFIDAGIQIGKGKLECFPNPKPYGEKGHYTYYNPHRLPLQPNSGSLLLDENGDILLSAENLTHEQMLAGFLVRVEQSAQAQDMTLLHRLMDSCYAKYTSNEGIAKYQHHHKEYSEVAREWKENLELTIQKIGWTAHHQTNTLLPNFIAYGVVFLGLKGEELKNCLYESIVTAPGYQEYCRHKHEIKNVIKDWVENTERQGYYVEYCGFPARSGLNPHLIAKRIKTTRNEHNENLAKRTEQRLNAILAKLQQLPRKVSEKIESIQAKSIELFGEAIARNTLYKSKYKQIWSNTETAVGATQSTNDPIPPINCPQNTANTNIQPLKPTNTQVKSQPQSKCQSQVSYTPPIYETFVGRVWVDAIHHQLQLCCINLFCESILDLRFQSERLDSELVFPTTESLPAISVVEVNFENESSIVCPLTSTLPPLPDAAQMAISIGTKLCRNAQRIAEKTYPALANCEVVSSNGLDWVVRDPDGYSWNVSTSALASGTWEVESEKDLRRTIVPEIAPDSRSAVEIARMVRLNAVAIPDELLLEFLHHPDLEAIQLQIELADALSAARSRDRVEELVADLSHPQKLDLWQVLTVEERSAVNDLMVRPKTLPLSSRTIESLPEDRSRALSVVGATVNTLTGLVGVVRHVFQSIAKPFLVYHESLGRTILYERAALRWVD